MVEIDGVPEITMTGLTKGKLLAIKNALEFQKTNKCLSFVGEDVLTVISKALEYDYVPKSFTLSVE